MYMFIYAYLYDPTVAVYGLPAPWGPNSNGKPLGGPSWNGGGEDSTDNIILGTGRKNGNRWQY